MYTYLKKPKTKQKKNLAQKTKPINMYSVISALAQAIIYRRKKKNCFTVTIKYSKKYHNF